MAASAGEPEMELWHRHEGSTPLLIDVPHCGTYVPPELAADMTEEGRRLPDTDWHVDKLYDFAPRLGAGMLVATHSRYVADLNRDPLGVPLYPGADNTEVCPLRSFAGADIWSRGRAPDADEVARRVNAFWRPYHVQLSAEIVAITARHGFCVLLDAHSIRSVLPRFFSGTLPHLNIGTAKGQSCAPALATHAAAVLASADRFTHVVDGRFTGGYITRHYGQPGAGVHALQLEIALRSYLSEERPEAYEPARAGPLRTLLQRFVKSLLAWSPGRVTGN
jgi:N-formylglutamate deformylase